MLYLPYESYTGAAESCKTGRPLEPIGRERMRRKYHRAGLRGTYTGRFDLPERHLRRRLTAWRSTDLCKSRQAKFGSAQTRSPDEWPLESPCRCHCLERTHTRHVPRTSLWESLFGGSSVRVETNRSPVAAVVEHLGRVYHPAIITLLMHSRDRENNPLDFTHPALQTSINMITTPQKEFNLLHRLRHQTPNEPIPLDCSTHLALSMGSELAHESTVARNDRTYSPKPRCERDSAKLLRRKQVFSEFIVKDSTSVPDDINRRPYSIWAGDANVAVSPTTVAQVGLTPPSDLRGSQTQQQLKPVGSIGRRAQIGDSSVNTGFNRQMLFGWDDTNALVAGYWSGIETPSYDINGPDYSVDTPTVSLYGTEDAATTDDLDDTDDNVSLSSMNQCEYMENFLSATSSHEQSNRTLFNPDRPLNLPLAVPELLTTSATTAGSNERESVIGIETDQLYSKSHGGLPNYSVSAAASSTVLASGAASTAVTPGSSEIIHLPSGSTEITRGFPTGSSPPSRDFGTPDLLAGMPNDEPQSPSEPMGSDEKSTETLLASARDVQKTNFKTDVVDREIR
ncbi:hypothetical protein FGIG_05423 [Fasciola gigantica]|uniref:Uncharacterized protein n=1 Tax=Fasciola gigantica TaxID=46835 RepID=A0A504Y8P0_FASGI|nr:hypothetical protein FGIG_05423 [Fasciola gigantica]